MKLIFPHLIIIKPKVFNELHIRTQFHAYVNDIILMIISELLTL